MCALNMGGAMKEMREVSEMVNVLQEFTGPLGRLLKGKLGIYTSKYNYMWRILPRMDRGKLSTVWGEDGRERSRK